VSGQVSTVFWTSGVLTVALCGCRASEYSWPLIFVCIVLYHPPMRRATAWIVHACGVVQALRLETLAG
jgi:hypothetical protein